MGMFDKDKEIGRNLTDSFDRNENFILYSVRVDEAAVPTDYGQADKTYLTVASLSDPDAKFEVTSLSGAIADKCKEAEDTEFPAVVCWMIVRSKKYANDATVLQFVRDHRRS